MQPQDPLGQKEVLGQGEMGAMPRITKLILSCNDLFKLMHLFLSLCLCDCSVCTHLDVYLHMHAVYFAYVCMFVCVNVLAWLLLLGACGALCVPAWG